MPLFISPHGKPFGSRVGRGLLIRVVVQKKKNNDKSSKQAGSSMCGRIVRPRLSVGRAPGAQINSSEFSPIGNTRSGQRSRFLSQPATGSKDTAGYFWPGRHNMHLPRPFWLFSTTRAGGHAGQEARTVFMSNYCSCGKSGAASDYVQYAMCCAFFWLLSVLGREFIHRHMMCVC